AEGINRVIQADVQFEGAHESLITEGKHDIVVTLKNDASSLAAHLKYLAQRIIGNQCSNHPFDESIGELNLFIAAKLKKYNDCVA
ncbi:hypothetical protein PT069_09275, partial [Erysipelothrix rhusiopathiae]|nr:hypothetical protein [Erysipelothrix rhusiopathiae]